MNRGIAIGAFTLLLSATAALAKGLHHLSLAADGPAVVWLAIGFAALHASAALANAGRFG